MAFPCDRYDVQNVANVHTMCKGVDQVAGGKVDGETVAGGKGSFRETDIAS